MAIKQNQKQTKVDIQYTKYLELKLSHSYFKDGISDVFQLVPFGETAVRLQNYNVLVDKRHNKHALFVGLQKEKDTIIKTHLKGIGNLFFQLIVDDPSFFNYTALQSLKENEALYFSNNTVNDSQQLHQSENASNQDICTHKPKIFNTLLPAGEIKLVIKNTSDDTVYQEEFSNQSSTYHLLNLSNLQDDYYKLWINDTLQESFFSSTQTLQSNCIGIVHLNIENQENEAYNIDFKARAVYWTYKIIIPKSRKIDVTSIAITHDTHSYEGPVKNQIVGGQEALVFKSTTLIALQQQLAIHPQLMLSYTSAISHRTNDLELKLPNPDNTSISKEKNEESFFSSTIVYV